MKQNPIFLVSFFDSFDDMRVEVTGGGELSVSRMVVGWLGRWGGDD